jgi:hypothetical protein
VPAFDRLCRKSTVDSPINDCVKDGFYDGPQRPAKALASASEFASTISRSWSDSESSTPRNSLSVESSNDAPDGHFCPSSASSTVTRASPDLSSIHETFAEVVGGLVDVRCDLICC